MLVRSYQHNTIQWIDIITLIVRCLRSLRIKSWSGEIVGKIIKGIVISMIRKQTFCYSILIGLEKENIFVWPIARYFVPEAVFVCSNKEITSETIGVFVVIPC